MKFIADVMLGRLARRLRLLGFDVAYCSLLDDNEIIRKSLEEHRVILTRDRALAGRPLASRSLFIESGEVDKQIEQVLSVWTPPGNTALTRCSHCNTPLTRITRQEAKDIVPRYVFENFEDFLHCTSCRRVYWKGTHVPNMKFLKTG